MEINPLGREVTLLSAMMLNVGQIIGFVTTALLKLAVSYSLGRAYMLSLVQSFILSGRSVYYSCIGLLLPFWHLVIPPYPAS